MKRDVSCPGRMNVCPGRIEGLTSVMFQLGMSFRKKIGRTHEYFEFVQESAEQSPSRISGTVEIMTMREHQCTLSASFIVMNAFLYFSDYTAGSIRHQGTYSY